MRSLWVTNTSGLIAPGVDAICFDMFHGSHNYVYREIDAVGTATVIPEPSTLALVGLALVPLFLRRRLN